MKSWTSLESQYLRLGDKRREERFLKIVHTFGQHPCSSVPQAFTNWYDIKACYKFWSSSLVMESSLQQAIFQATSQRCQGQETVLSVQDTSNLSFRVDAEGLGYLDHGAGRGLICHNNLLVSTHGVPLGLIDQQIWSRDPAEMGKKKTRGNRAIEEKESYKWILSKTRAEDFLCDHITRLITIADREADIYELFAYPRPDNSELLIRASHDRKTPEGDSIWQELDDLPAQKKTSIDLPGTPGKKPRKAKLEMTWGSFTIQPPENKKDLSPIVVQAMLVKEPNPPKAEKALCWKLIMSLPIETGEDALLYKQWYTLRWLIERFHYVLKSGCGLESLQLQKAEQLRKATITLSLVAYKLLWLLLESRKDPDQPCTKVLTDQEWKALYCNKFKSTKYPDNPPTVQQAVRWIGILGGFIGRKRDGEPGVKNLWRGLRTLEHLTGMWQNLQK